MAKDLQIIYEDNHLLVINKPAVLATMGAAPGKPSLLEIGKDYIRKKYNKPGNVYLGVVSRLDSFVTGVIVVARTSKAAARLSEQFRNKSVEKTYLAIVPDGKLESSGQLENWMIKDEPNHRMMTVKDGFKNGKLARLAYEKIGSDQQYCLLKIKLETGRKHQIRVQLAAAKCPIIGDKKYGSRQPFKIGIALHSQSLTIEHPTKRQPMAFSAEPPPWWHLDKFGYKQE